jgi:hypothetical protein
MARTIPSEFISEAVRAKVNTGGLRAAARELDLACDTVLKLAARVRVTGGTLAQVERKLGLVVSSEASLM